MCEESYRQVCYACRQMAWALNFWWILKVSGLDKVKEKEKNGVQYFCRWGSRSLAHPVPRTSLKAVTHYLIMNHPLMIQKLYFWTFKDGLFWIQDDQFGQHVIEIFPELTLMLVRAKRNLNTENLLLPFYLWPLWQKKNIICCKKYRLRLSLCLTSSYIATIFWVRE